MTKPSFLARLAREEKLKLTEPSKEISESYLNKSSNSLRAAELLLNSDLFEESVSLSYYSMYHCLSALLIKCGIKCENHAGSILLLKKLFDAKNLYGAISKAKEERIDKQYYVDLETVKEDAEALITNTQQFVTGVKLIIEGLTQKEIELKREKLGRLIGR